MSEGIIGRLVEEMIERIHSRERTCSLTLSQLGIFLCVRCGSLHRKLGTHISKVKSLSMDSWTVDQVDVSWLSA
jgi:hypothetical protein